MKKKISEFAILAGALLVMFGLIVCMFETVDSDKQVVSMIYGFGTMVVGAITCYLGNEGSHYYGQL